MMEWWYVIVVAVLVAAVVLYLWSCRTASRPPSNWDRGRGDYAQGREDVRVAGMNQEDRDWEAASRQRDADRRGPGGPG